MTAPPAGSPSSAGPALAGLRVLDVSTLFAGPMAATMLGDFGADVVKVEHPRGDPVRTHGASKDGVGLWGKVVGRNKRGITLNLSDAAGQEVFRRLAAGADVVIENFRPGTLERWGLGYEELSRDNPGLVLVRVTGFGQFGPYSSRPGFGTLAEAMSGFAAITGEPDGPPTLPPFGLADGISALTAAYATLAALRARDATGRGQVVDLAISEPILTVVGPQPTVYDATGQVQQRTGNRSANNAPRNTYRTRDGRWVAVALVEEDPDQYLVVSARELAVLAPLHNPGSLAGNPAAVCVLDRWPAVAPNVLRLGLGEPGEAVVRRTKRDIAVQRSIIAEDVAEFAVVPLGPEMGFGGRIDELRGHPDAVAGLADTPLENIADPEFAPDGAHIHGLSLVGEHRVAGDHEEALELRQRGGDVLGEPVAEELLLRVGAHGVERQHGNGWSIRKYGPG